MLKKLLLIIIALVLTLSFSSCILKESNRKTKGLTVHEWGVMVEPRNEKNIFKLSNPYPEKLDNAEKPVIYLYADKPVTINASISLKSNKYNEFTDNYPVVEPKNQKISWSNVQIKTAKASKKVKLIGLKPGMVWQKWADVMAEAQANNLVYKGNNYPYLFYEGNVFYKEIISLFRKDKELFINNQNSYSVFDVNLRTGNGYCFIEEIKPGLMKISLSKKSIYKINLMKIGFYKKEEDAFKKVWSGLFYIKSSLREKYSSDYILTYRLPQAQYDNLCRLEIMPKPKEIQRALFIAKRGNITKK